MTRLSAAIATPLGRVGLIWDGDVLMGVDLDPAAAAPGDDGEPVPDSLTRALDAYFRDGSYRFELPLRLIGTAFQRRVWQALQAIPPGCTLTYGEIARQLATSARAVGGACRDNPCPIVVPCHRVVAADGLGGFAGDRSGRKLEVKRWLLRHEGIDFGSESGLR
jgi:methylated-DNA-[protein]-cysteine S-methyltransferase